MTSKRYEGLVMYCARFGGSEHSRNRDLRGSKTAFYILKLKIRSTTSLLKTRQCSCYEIQKPLNTLTYTVFLSSSVFLSYSFSAHSCPHTLCPGHTCHLPSPSTLPPAPGPLHLLSLLYLWFGDHSDLRFISTITLSGSS